MIEPLLIARKRLFRSGPITGWTTVREALLDLGLSTLDQVGLLYTPRIRMGGVGVLAAARQSHTGTLIIGSDGSVRRLLLRALQPIEPRVVPVADYSEMRIPGSPTIVQTIQKSPTFLVRVRTALRNDVVVVAIITNRNALTEDNLPAPTPGGVIGISTGMIRLALRCGSPIVFYSARLQRDGVVDLNFDAPSPTAAGQPDNIAREFIAFMDRHSPR